MKNVAKRCVA